MKWLPETACRHQTVVFTAVFFLVAWGAYSFYTMPRREDPEFTIMTCVVTTRWPGASATKVEQLITDPLEEILDGIEQVDVIKSTSINGQSTIFVELEPRTPADQVDQVWDQVRARVRRVPMPDAAITPIVDDSFGDTTILLLAIHQIPLASERSIARENEYTPRELDVISDRVRESLRRIPGVSRAQRFGIREEAIYIETDAGTWSKLTLTSSALKTLVASRNIVQPGGTIDTREGRFFVQPGGELNAVNEIHSIIAAASAADSGYRQVYLRDLGLNVRRDYQDPPPMLCRYGDPTSSTACVMIALTMKPGANLIDICDAAMKRVDELQNREKMLPVDIGITPISDQSESVQARIQAVIGNVIGAIAIVIFVVFLVVGFRTAAVMAANIPFVVLSSIGLITLFGVQLEQMSLASMIIALGLLVDNAVQVCDQSRSNQIAGMDPVTATIEGATVLAVPMLNGTLTTIAAFVPMLIAIEGNKREFIYSLPVTLSVMLAVSWVLAMTFCVILCTKFIRPPRPGQARLCLKRGLTLSPPKGLTPFQTERRWRTHCRTIVSSLAYRLPGMGRAPLHCSGQPVEPNRDCQSSASRDLVDRWFRLFANYALRHKFGTLAVALGLFLLAIRLPIGSEFFPQCERDQFVVNVWLPETASIEQTNQAAKQVESMIRKLSPIENQEGGVIERLVAMRTLVGGGGSRWYMSWNPEPIKPNYAEILVRTASGKWTHGFAQQIKTVALAGDLKAEIEPLVGVRVVPEEMMLGPPAAPVALRVIGTGFAEMTRLRHITDQVKGLVAAESGTWNVHDSWGVDGYQLRVDVDEDRANRAGVTNAEIAATLNAYFSGLLLTTFREGDHQVPVYFRLCPEQRRSTADLDATFVEGKHGKVPLSAIATVTAQWEPAVIERRDLNRTIEVRANVQPGVSGNDVVLSLMKSEAMQRLQAELPNGYHIEVGGALEESRKGIEMMLKSFALSFALIVFLLVLQYNSLVKALVIICTLPLAMTGALFGLWLTDHPLGFMPQLGVLALFGIVLNTGIIYIEFADILIGKYSERLNHRRRLTQEELRECLVQAGKDRLLPIFLTTATTVGGLIPLALRGGPLWQGMSWLMIFGLMAATLLTLLVIPALYLVIGSLTSHRPKH